MLPFQKTHFEAFRNVLKYGLVQCYFRLCVQVDTFIRGSLGETCLWRLIANRLKLRNVSMITEIMVVCMDTSISFVTFSVLSNSCPDEVQWNGMLN